MCDDIALYAEDVLLFMEDPVRSDPRALEILQLFGNYTGLRMNLAKSMIYTMGRDSQDVA